MAKRSVAGFEPKGFDFAEGGYFNDADISDIIEAVDRPLDSEITIVDYSDTGESINVPLPAKTALKQKLDVLAEWYLGWDMAEERRPTKKMLLDEFEALTSLAGRLLVKLAPGYQPNEGDYVDPLDSMPHSIRWELSVDRNPHRARETIQSVYWLYKSAGAAADRIETEPDSGTTKQHEGNTALNKLIHDLLHEVWTHFWRLPVTTSSSVRKESGDSGSPAVRFVATVVQKLHRDIPNPPSEDLDTLRRRIHRVWNQSK